MSNLMKFILIVFQKKLYEDFQKEFYSHFPSLDQPITAGTDKFETLIHNNHYYFPSYWI